MTKKTLSFSLIILFLVFFVSAFFSLWVYLGLVNEFGVPYYNGGGSDDYLYELQAKEFKNEFGWYDKDHIKRVIGSPFHNSTGFVWFLSKFVYFVEGFSAYSTKHFRVFNCFLLSLSAMIYFNCVRNLQVFSVNESFLIALVSFTLPFVLYINSFVFRDTIIIFMLIFYLFSLQRLYINLLSGAGWSRLILYSSLIFSISFSMYSMRAQYAVVFIILYVFLVLYKFKDNFSRKISVSFVCVLIVVFFLFSHYLGLLGELMRLIYIYQDYVSESSQGFTSIIFNQPLPVTAVLRVVFSPFYPIPEIGLGYKLLIFINIALQVVLFPVIVFGFLRLFHVPLAMPLLLLFTFTYFGVVWGTYTFRHFFYISPFYPLFFFYGYKHFRSFHWYAIPVLVFMIIAISFFIIRFN